MSPLRGEGITGRTVEEAIERGLRALGRKRTEVDIEVPEKGKPANVLGMGGEDACDAVPGGRARRGARADHR